MADEPITEEQLDDLEDFVDSYEKLFPMRQQFIHMVAPNDLDEHEAIFNNPEDIRLHQEALRAHGDRPLIYAGYEIEEPPVIVEKPIE